VYVPRHFDHSHLRGFEMNVERVEGKSKRKQNRHVGEMMR
jgi:predicted FMN-binding regulatory protein PaiB